MSDDWPTWTKGTRVMWRGRWGTVEAQPGQVPVKLESTGDVVMAWADDLQLPKAPERSDPEGER